MSEVNRWDLCRGNAPVGTAEMKPDCEYGPYVLYADHARVLAEKDAEIERLTTDIATGNAILAADVVRQYQHELSLAEQRERKLREALLCWPLKDVLQTARNAGNEYIAMLFEEVRDAALAQPAPKETA